MSLVHNQRHQRAIMTVMPLWEWLTCMAGRRKAGAGWLWVWRRKWEFDAGNGVLKMGESDAGRILTHEIGVWRRKWKSYVGNGVLKMGESDAGNGSLTQEMEVWRRKWGLEIWESDAGLADWYAMRYICLWFIFGLDYLKISILGSVLRVIVNYINSHWDLLYYLIT